MRPTSSSDLHIPVKGKHLAAFLVAALVSCAVPADTAPILLSCHGEPKTDPTVIASLCDALEAELNERKPERVMRRSAAPDPRPGRVWDVVLEVTRTENYHWEGHLTWVKTGRRERR